MSLDNFKKGQSSDISCIKANKFSAAVFWGSIWGLAEATLGYLLHVSKIPGLAGAVMPAVAFYLLYRLYRQTGSTASVISASLMAAGLKGLDIMFSPLGFMDIINPAQAIILEGLVAAACLKILDREVCRQSQFILTGLLFSFGSNLAYGLMTLAASLAFKLSNIFQAEPARLVKFFLLSPLVTAGLLATASIIRSLAKRIKDKESLYMDSSSFQAACRLKNCIEQAPFRPDVSLAVFILAVLANLIQLWSW